MLKLMCFLFAMHFSPNDKWQTYTDSLSRYTIKYPTNWTIKYYKNIIAFLSPLDGENDKFHENVNVMIQDLTDEPLTLKQYNDVTSGGYQEVYGDSAFVAMKDTTFAGYPATMGIFNMLDKSDPHKVKQYWFIKDNKAYVLTYTAEPAQFNKYLSVAMRVIKSFKIPK